MPAPQILHWSMSLGGERGAYNSLTRHIARHNCTLTQHQAGRRVEARSGAERYGRSQQILRTLKATDYLLNLLADAAKYSIWVLEHATDSLLHTTKVETAKASTTKNINAIKLTAPLSSSTFQAQRPESPSWPHRRRIYSAMPQTWKSGVPSSFAAGAPGSSAMRASEDLEWSSLYGLRGESLLCWPDTSGPLCVQLCWGGEVALMFQKYVGGAESRASQWLLLG